MTARYFAQYNDENRIVAIGTGHGGTEITESEYNALLAEIREKAALVEELYSGEITLDEVPADWQEEIRRRVNERITADGEAAEQPVSGDEFLSMLEGVL